MKTLAEIDPNFQVDAIVPTSAVFFDPREAPCSIWGLVPNEERTFYRLPLSMLSECSEGVQRLAFHLAGGCVRFSTDSDYLAVLWELPQGGTMGHFTACGERGMALYTESDEGARQVKTLIPQMLPEGGCQLQQTSLIPLPGGMRHYALYLPLYSGLSSLLLGIAPDAQMLPGRTPALEKPLVFYGSSITQGGCAATAGACYPALLARRLDAAQINLGFSGNAKGEGPMARYIAGLDMSVFIFDYDHNAPDAAHLRATHAPFFQIVRQAQPRLPIVMVSRPDFDREPGPARERRQVILETYLNALAAGDRHVYFVDGEGLFGNRNREECTVDGCHPTNLGFLRMADGIEPVLRRALAEREEALLTN